MFAPLVAAIALLATLIVIQSRVVPDTTADQLYYQRSEQVLHESLLKSEETLASVEKCTLEVNKALEEQGAPLFQDIEFLVHRNGESESCANAAGDLALFQQALAALDIPCGDMDKYGFEALLTDIFSKSLDESSCSSTYYEDSPSGFLNFCDMGDDRTPILLDYEDLVQVDDHLPCHFHTREGLRITNLEHLAELAKISRDCDDAQEQTCQAKAQLHLYAVPAGRHFLFAPSHVGEIFQLPHVEVPNGEPVYLKTLSLSPLVLDIINFFTKDESAELVDKALKETSETHRMKRSTTGTKENSINSQRTSENGFDTHGKMALQVKRRCFDVLGFDEYLEGHSDGLQILRYNQTNAYIPHMDYMTSRTDEPFDYDSAHTGGNRYATILLYMSDLEEGDGGETVFPSAWPPDLPVENRVELNEALEELRASGEANGLLKNGSWEERLAAQCKTRLAIRPNSARAVLFYSQLPDGRPDPMSKHGACPILKGEKWAANLWVWSTPREDFAGAPIKENYRDTYQENRPKQLHATFRNSGKNPEYKGAVLYFDEGGYWGELEKGTRLAANTYQGHKWNVKVDDKIIKTWVIGPDAEQEFVL